MEQDYSQLMEVGVISEIGLSVQMTVVKAPKPELNFATTLLLLTVVLIVKERTLKLKSARRNVQVIVSSTIPSYSYVHSYNFFEECSWAKY